MVSECPKTGTFIESQSRTLTFDHSLQMCMQQTPLGHPLRNLPQLCTFHPILRKRKHHPWIHITLVLLDLFRPHCGCFMVSNVPNDCCGSFGCRRKALAERVVCTPANDVSLSVSNLRGELDGFLSFFIFLPWRRVFSWAMRESRLIWYSAR